MSCQPPKGSKFFGSSLNRSTVIRNWSPKRFPNYVVVWGENHHLLLGLVLLLGAMSWFFVQTYMKPNQRGLSCGKLRRALKSFTFWRCFEVKKNQLSGNLFILFCKLFILKLWLHSIEETVRGKFESFSISAVSYDGAVWQSTFCVW